MEGQSDTCNTNGHLLANGTHIYTYDTAHHLRSATDGTITSTYVYNGMGDRVAQTVDGTTTEYTLDSARNLPQVIAAHDGTTTTPSLQIQGQLRARTRLLP